jgi:hypothetical membrane protein
MTARKLSRFQAFWVRLWMTLLLVGLFLFLLGIYPDLIGMDRSPVVGFVQVGFWLFGLALTLVSAYATIRILRSGRATSLRAEIGERLIATGYVVAAAASLADFIGIGSHEIPDLIFGPLQVIGLVVGVVTGVAGLILYWPWIRRRKAPLEDVPYEDDTEPLTGVDLNQF